MTVAMGRLIQKCKQRRQVWAKNAEQNHSDSVSGLPCQTAVEGNGGRCCGGSYKATAIGGVGW